MRSKNISIIIAILLCVLAIGSVGYSRYTDMIDNSDVTSFLGAMFGGFIGVFGAIFGIYKSKEVDKKENIKKLIEMFKHTYIWVYPRYYLGARGYEKSFKEPVVPLIYDENWKSYITELENSHHKKFLLNWFYTLESLQNKKDFIPRIKESHINEAIKIIKHYNLYDSEVKNIEKIIKSDVTKKLRKDLIGCIDCLEAIEEARIASCEEQEQLYWEQNRLYEDYEEEPNICTQEEMLDMEVSSAIHKFEKLMRSNDSIYDFRKIIKSRIN